MPREETSLDSGAVYVALVAAAVVLVGCVCGADWVRPPEDGTGPWLTPGRLQALKIVAGVAAGLVALCVARAIRVRSRLPVYAAVVLVAAVGLLGGALLLKPPRVGLEAIGFDADQYRVPTENALMFANTTGADVTVCLGIRGDCDAEAPGPQRLRSPGLVVPPNHRVAVPMPGRSAVFRITIATPGGGVIRRDATIDVFYQNNGV